MNIVLDLDETLIKSKIMDINYIQNKPYNKKVLCWYIENNQIKIIFERDNIETFFKYITNNNYNIYVNTNTKGDYATAIIESLKNRYNIDKQIKIYNFDNRQSKKKNLKEMKLNNDDTIIIDDSPEMWDDKVNYIIKKYNNIIDKDDELIKIIDDLKAFSP